MPTNFKLARAAIDLGNLSQALTAMIDEMGVDDASQLINGVMTIDGVIIGRKNNATSMRVKGLQHPSEGSAEVQSYSGIFYNDGYNGTGKLKTRVIHGANVEMDIEIQGPHQVRIIATDGTQTDGEIYMASKTDVVIDLRAEAETASPRRLIFDRVDTSTTGLDNTSDVNIKSTGNLRLKHGQTDGAIIVPVLTTAERDALTGVAGMIIFNSTAGLHQGFDGTLWKDLYA